MRRLLLTLFFAFAMTTGHAKPQAAPRGLTLLPLPSLPSPLYCKIQREMTSKYGANSPTVTKMSTEYWMKGNNLRIETQQEGSPKMVILIQDLKTAYTFKKGEKKAQRANPMLMMLMSARIRELLPQTGKRTVTGQEKIQNISCEVSTIELPQPAGQRPAGKRPGAAASIVFSPTKEWVWKDRKIALKRESARTSPDMSVHERWTVTDITVDKPLDDALFSVQGMEIVESAGLPGRRMGGRSPVPTPQKK